jgi:predicted trehalose synthase
VNAFLEIVSQLVAAVEPEQWLNQRFFPFADISAPRARLSDACIFRQNATGALGVLWVSFLGSDDLMTLPFRLARYSEDGDLIYLTPWSLREASADREFFEAWKFVFHNKHVLLTENGAQFSCKSCGGEPNLLALNVYSDAKSVLTRVEQQEALKIFRVSNKDSGDCVEVEMLEFLNQQKIFLSFPRLISVYEYSSRDLFRTHIAISSEYVQNNGALWHDFLGRLNHARFPDVERERSSREAWFGVLKSGEQVGRLLGEFHRAMTHARDNPNLVPEGNTGEVRKAWLERIELAMISRSDWIDEAPIRFGKGSSALRNVRKIAKELLERVQQFESLGIRIRTHGRIHLGHILNGVKGLYLFDFGVTSGLDPGEDPEFSRLKHPALKDLAALNLSLKYAWLVTDRRGRSPILDEFLDRPIESRWESWFGSKDRPTLPAAGRRFADIESAVLRAYMSAIGEEASATELVPNTPGGFLALYDLLFFLRILRECKKDYKSGNPRLKTSIKILEEFVRDRRAREGV